MKLAHSVCEGVSGCGTWAVCCGSCIVAYFEKYLQDVTDIFHNIFIIFYTSILTLKILPSYLQQLCLQLITFDTTLPFAKQNV